MHKWRCRVLRVEVNCEFVGGRRFFGLCALRLGSGAVVLGLNVFAFNTFTFVGGFTLLSRLFDLFVKVCLALLPLVAGNLVQFLGLKPPKDISNLKRS